MYDYGLSTLEQYGLTAESTARTRGGLLCHTEKGLVIVKEFKGTEKKLQKQQELLLQIQSQGGKVDCYIPNQCGVKPIPLTIFGVVCRTGVRCETIQV